MLQVVPGVLDTAHCHFSTEDLQHGPESFRSVPVSLNSSTQSPFNRRISSEVLLAAWSVVLRYYVGSDVISFGRVDDTADAGSRFAVCHGEIPAETPLKSLCAFDQGLLGDKDTAQSPRDWIKACTSINTVVWNTPLSPSSLELQALEDTQVRRRSCLTKAFANRSSVLLC